jgi:DNA repair photolyase
MMSFGSSTEYTINQYRGCTHGCVYCYAPSLIHDERSWGSFVDVKINAPSILDKELAHAKKQVVFVSSASDPYQPVEARFKVTRKVLEVLSRHKFPVIILTRSPLVTRDMDVLRSFEWVRVGFSISSVSSKFYEPGVPTVENRVQALCRLRDCGITTWVSMAPIIPNLLVTDLDWLFPKLKDARVSAVTMGLLRFNGYEKSRQMFEERSGETVDRAMEGGTSVYREIASRAKSWGLDTSGVSLVWTGDSSKDPSLDNFAS